jgi:hypothetical protein
MFQLIKTREAGADNSGAVEARDHFKNGASLKSQMSRRNSLKKIIVAFAVLTTMMFTANAQKFAGGGLGFDLAHFAGADIQRHTYNTISQ